MTDVKIKNLTYTYPDGRTGLDDINIEITKGMKLALLGGNGSGKTTLLLHLNGLLDGRGEITVFGMKRKKSSIKEIRRRIGFLFSDVHHHFIMPDLLNDVMLGMSGMNMSVQSKKENASAWIDKFGLSDYSRCSPLELSSGEMKRAAMAGIMASDPGMLVLDEPLNNIDKKNSLMLLNILSSIDLSMIIATHRSIVAENLATHIAVMHDGQISEPYEKKEALKMNKVKNLLF